MSAITDVTNSLENVSQSAADIQQACLVKNKDIRVRLLLA